LHPARRKRRVCGEEVLSAELNRDRRETVLNDLLVRLEALGKMGLTVSIVYGPCGNMGTMYSVDVLSLDGQFFDKPFVCETFEKAVWIAEKETKERGWIAH